MGKIGRYRKNRADRGFDIRGYENLYENNTIQNDDENEILYRSKVGERVWLIQCKREKNITPKKLRGYLDELTKLIEFESMLFVTSCDLSIETRDIFYKTLSEKGINEFHIWGRPELEDKLFQPEFDHLLFAYFGISLNIRRKSIKSNLSHILSIKRKIYSHYNFNVGDNWHKEFIVIDPSNNNYPFERDKFGWKKFNSFSYHYEGIKVLLHKYPAYNNTSNNLDEWDYTELYDMRSNFSYSSRKKTEEQIDLEERIRNFLSTIPENNRGELNIYGLIPYEKIIDFDKDGDFFNRFPHIYLYFDNNGPFVGGIIKILEYKSDGILHNILIKSKEDKRIKFFPSKFKKVKKNKM